MGKHIHGGDIYALQGQGSSILDFSVNTNPLGMPKGVIDAARDAIFLCEHYPDPLCRELAHALAQSEGVRQDQLVFGNGAADIIFRLVFSQKPQRAMVLAPTFAEYKQALMAAGCEVVHHFLSVQDGFCLTQSILDELDGIDILFLCNPNNPTSKTIEPALLLRILEECKRSGILLVVDECFNCFLDEPNAHTLKHKLDDYPNLFILQAFTKLYAMAGLRLGYGLCANTALLEKMSVCSQPWSVSVVAQRAGVAALKETDYVQNARELIIEERKYLLEQLGILGIEAIGHEANYIFFRSPYALEKLKAEGILIRSCANFSGLDSTYYRIAIKTHGQNIKLIVSMKKTCAAIGKGE